MVSTRLHEMNKWLTEQAQKKDRSEGEQKSQLFSLAKNFSRAKFKKPHKCMLPKCDQNTIRSHIFQKGSHMIGAVMNKVSSNGITISSHYVQSAESLQLKKISTGTEATFAGFCEEHDRLFHEFEQHGYLFNKKHFILQAYRSACREVSIRENLSSAMENSISEIRHDIIEKISGDFIANFAPTPDELSWFTQRVNGMKFWIDTPLAKQFLDNFGIHSRSANKISILCEKLQKYAESEGRKCPKHLFFSRITISTELPIAISGTLVSKPDKRGDSKVLLVVVFPNNKKQEMIFVCTSGDEIFAKMFIGKLTSDTECIKFIERFAISQTDCWFLNPEHLEKMTTEQQNTLSEALSKAGDQKFDEVPCVFGFNNA